MEQVTRTLTCSSSSAVVNNNQCSSIENFPLEVVLEIISRLPQDLETITRLKFVSKWFCKMIEDSCMIQRIIAREEPGVLIVSHDNVTGSTTLFHARDENNVKPIYRAPFRSENPGKSLVECYFKGLISFCIRDDVEEQLVICNPLTREYVTLPGMAKAKTPNLSMYSIGCGRLSKEYKVLRIHNIEIDHRPKVYTLGKSSSWRDISSFPPYVFYSKTVFANGAVHWKIDPFYGTVCVGEERILSFDIDKEEFYVTEHPEELGHRMKNDMIDMIQYGESLGFADFSSKTHIDIWVHHDNVDKRWVKECVIKFEIPKHPKDKSWDKPTMNDFTVIGLWQQGEILISRDMAWCRHAYDPICWNKHCFYSYDGRTGCVREVTDMIQISPSTVIQRVCGYSRSLMSLKRYGYGDTEL